MVLLYVDDPCSTYVFLHYSLLLGAVPQQYGGGSCNYRRIGSFTDAGNGSVRVPGVGANLRFESNQYSGHMGILGLPFGAGSGRIFDHATGGTDGVCVIECGVCVYRQTGIFEVSGWGKVET